MEEKSNAVRPRQDTPEVPQRILTPISGEPSSNPHEIESTSMHQNAESKSNVSLPEGSLTGDHQEPVTDIGSSHVRSQESEAKDRNRISVQSAPSEIGSVVEEKHLSLDDARDRSDGKKGTPGICGDGLVPDAKMLEGDPVHTGHSAGAFVDVCIWSWKISYSRPVLDASLKLYCCVMMSE